VLVDTREDMKVVQEEIFGPVVVAIPFSEPAELVPRANDNVYGLAAGFWTRDISKAHRIADQIAAGTVGINCYNIFDAALPFGGYKQSGWGREMGHEVLNNYTQTKAVCARI
jgi:phenylacetaldehyde dehydrogenase